MAKKLLRYIVKIEPDKPDGYTVEKEFKTELLALRFVYNFCIENHRNIQNVHIYTNEEEVK